MSIQELIIDEDSIILEAMERLDKVAKKVLFIEKENKLIASLTDGDIRRWIMAKGELSAPIKNAANYNPKFLIQATKKEAVKYMKQHSIEALPILNREHKIINVVLWNENDLTEIREKLNVPVVVMAGGLGTRLYPYTKILPKPLIPVGDIPIAEHIINRFHEFGCNQFYMILNHKKNMIKAYFNEISREYSIHYFDEELPLGTGGGLSLLKGKIDSTFILTNCDILISEDILKVYKLHKQQKNMITMICSLKNFRIPYGVVEIGSNGEIETMKEKPSISYFTNTGCYIVEPEVIEQLEKNKSIGFPDVIQAYKDKGEKVGVYPISENSWLDMGQIDELEKMREKLLIN